MCDAALLYEVAKDELASFCPIYIDDTLHVVDFEYCHLS